MKTKFIDEEKINASVLREEQLKKAKEKPKSEIMFPMLLTAIIVPIFGIYAFFHHVNVFLTSLYTGAVIRPLKMLFYCLSMQKM